MKLDLSLRIDFDETSTTQVKKLMNLSFYYCTWTHSKVWVIFYTLLFFRHVSGDKIASNLFNQMATYRLPMNKLVTVVLDHPNVN